MKRRLSILAFSLLVTSAQAQTGDPMIAAGEHGRFSRIVVQNGGADIEVVQTDRQVKLYNVTNPSAFNLRDVNLLRKAHRVLQAEKVLMGNGGYIELTLACDCQVEASSSYDGKFVIDVMAKEQSHANGADPKAPQDGKPEEHKESKPVNPSIEEDRMTVAQARDRMVSLLQQAADNGLISVEENDESPLHITPQEEETYETATPETIGEHIVLAGDLNNKQETAQPIEAAPVKTEKPANNANSTCLNDQVLEIKNDKFEEAPLVQITELQSAIVDASGADRDHLTRELISGFLSIGFGAEALALLNDQGAENSPLADISRIIAERPVDQNSRLLSAEGCSGAHALWQAAAETPDNVASKVEASGNAVSALPSRLKSMIATRIAAKLVEAEAWEKAEEFAEFARENASTDDPTLALIEAQLLAHAGDDHEARKSLRQIAAQNSTASKEALLSLADSYEKNEAPYHDGFIEDVGAHSKVEKSSTTAIAEAMAWADVGNFGAAMMILRNEATKSESRAEKARASAFKILNQGFDQEKETTVISALDAYLENDDWISSTLWSPEWRQDLAQIVTRIGLPNLALVLLEETPANKTALDLDKSRTAFLADQPEQAISIAASHADDPEFAKLIAQSNIKLKRYFAALATAMALPDEQDKARFSAKAAWLGRDWKSAASAFQTRDPRQISKEEAIQYALAAYQADEQKLPPAIDAVLAQEAPALINGVRSLFLKTPTTGSAVERTQEIVDRANAELEFFEEVLTDG